jgi:hypothetical protein
MPCKETFGCAGAGFHPPFSRTVAVDRVPQGGQKGRVEADEAERAALAALYGAEEIKRLTFEYEIKPKSKGRFHLVGRMEGELVQACVITLEPVEETISETVDLEFWPPADIDEPRMASARGAGLKDAGLEGAGFELAGPGAPEPLHNGVIDVAAVAAEFLSSSMNPYPRKADAEFCWSDERQSASGPFAALKKLKSP